MILNKQNLFFYSFILIFIFIINIVHFGKSSFATKVDDLIYLWLFGIAILSQLKSRIFLIPKEILLLITWYIFLLLWTLLINPNNIKLFNLYYYATFIIAIYGVYFYIKNKVFPFEKVILILLYSNFFIMLFEFVLFNLFSYNLMNDIVINGHIRPSGLLVNSAYSNWLNAILAIYFYNNYIVTKRKGMIAVFLVLVLFISLFYTRKPLLDIFLYVIISLIFYKNYMTTKMRIILNILLLSFILIVIALQFSLFQRMILEYIINPDSAMRSQMIITGLFEMLRLFPIGNGFASLGSYPSVVFDSHLYYQYGLDNVYGFGTYSNGSYEGFLLDSYYPQLFGESGFIGTLFYIGFLVMLFKFSKNYLGKSKISLLLPQMIIFVPIESIGTDIFNNPAQKFVLVLFVAIILRYKYEKNKYIAHI